MGRAEIRQFGPLMIAETEAELRVATATVQLVHFRFDEPVDQIVREDEAGAYRLDLCLTPRTPHARVCYRDHWSLERFEPLGKVFVLPPAEPVHARSDLGSQTSIVCHLHPEPIRAWFGGELQWIPGRLEASLDIPSANIRGLLMRLAEEARHPGFASELIVELVAAQLAVELSRYCAATADGPVTGGLAPWRLRLIDERLREVRSAPTLAELAGLCRLSVRQLTRGFRESRGCSIGDYVAQSQVEHARRLLATDQPVKAIAYSLGFSSPSKLALAFRRRTGETPREFRRRSGA